MLTNEIEQAVNWYDDQSSPNDAQATLGRAGILRIVIAARNPGVANSLDTAG